MKKCKKSKTKSKELLTQAEVETMLAELAEEQGYNSALGLFAKRDLAIGFAGGYVYARNNQDTEVCLIQQDSGDWVILYNDPEYMDSGVQVGLGQSADCHFSWDETFELAGEESET